MKNLILFGDSLFGLFDKELIDILEEKLPGYRVYNCAARGQNSNDCSSQANYISQLNPEILAISLGLNDSAPWKKVPLVQFKQNIENILSYFPKSKIIFLLPPPIDETIDSRPHKRTNNLIDKYSEATREVCLKKGAMIINSPVLFKPLLGSKEYYHVEDGTHLNEVGYMLVIEKLAELARE